MFWTRVRLSSPPPILLVNRVGKLGLTSPTCDRLIFSLRQDPSKCNACGMGMLKRSVVYKKSPHAEVAQLAEQITCNEKVGGSIPLLGTILKSIYVNSSI